MSLLSDGEIIRLIECGEIGLDPFDKTMIQPASVDLRLDSTFMFHSPIKKRAYTDPREDSIIDWVTQEAYSDKGIILNVGDFALASTYERVRIPNGLAGRFEGKSSLGRLGLLTHITAGFIDPGFDGHITLELANVSRLPILLMPGMKIGQLCFMEMGCHSDRPYGHEGAGSHYQGQRGPTASRSHINFHRTEL